MLLVGPKGRGFAPDATAEIAERVVRLTSGCELEGWRETQLSSWCEMECRCPTEGFFGTRQHIAFDHSTDREAAVSVGNFFVRWIFLQARKPTMKMIMLLMMLADAETGSAATPDVQLLDFTASYCQPCQQMVPILQRMERDKFPVRKIDITEEHELARRFNVDRVPTLVLMVEGKEAKRFIGLTDEAELRSEMNKAARRLAEARGEDTGPQLAADATPEQLTPGAKDSNEDIQTADATETSRGSMKDIFRGMLNPGGKQKKAFEYPTLRGQSPEEDIKVLTGLTAASAATVRVRVAGTSTKDGTKVQDVGTGTIVYSATGQAIVLTCAHVFLDISTKEADVEVEVYENGKPVSYRASLIGGDHDADLAFLKLQTSKTMPSVRLTSLAPKVAKGQGLVSFGCNNGSDPTRLDTKVADINRYDGPANLVCTTDPVSGRSGGGLFTSNGELVGVCSCADRKRHEGLYMAYEPIISLVKTLKLQSILLAPSAGDGEDAASSFADLLENKSDGTQRKTQVADVPAADTQPKEIAKTDVPEFDGSEDTLGIPSGPTEVALVEEEGELTDAPLFNPAGDAKTVQTAEAMPVAARTGGPKVTILIDDQTPGSQTRVIVIPKASLWMMELLTGESDELSPSSMTSAPRPATASTGKRTRLTKQASATRTASQAP
jgi:thiol-disulfide isomerase/thioredoxin